MQAQAARAPLLGVSLQRKRRDVKKGLVKTKGGIIKLQNKTKGPCQS